MCVESLCFNNTCSWIYNLVRELFRVSFVKDVLATNVAIIRIKLLWQIVTNIISDLKLHHLISEVRVLYSDSLKEVYNLLISNLAKKHVNISFLNILT